MVVIYTTPKSIHRFQYSKVQLDKLPETSTGRNRSSGDHLLIVISTLPPPPILYKHHPNSTMNLLSLLGALTLLITSIYATSLPSTTEILYWPLGSAQPSVLARVAYDATSLKSNILAYNPPKPNPDHSISSSDELVRLGLYTQTTSNPKQWSGSLVSLSSLTGEYPPTLRLHLGPGPKSEVYHVSVAAFEPVSQKGSEPSVDLVLSEAGAQPHLNRPVVVGPDGQNAEEVPEKTLFQKYWWVLLIMMFLTMSGGGGGEGQ
ncbi:hypothetical protein F1880_000016 [Penicillium rolfsii]|nr:hypothetical protein F1880_000016 [Penicillium rolfsii]